MNKELINRVANREESALEDLERECRPLIMYVVRPLLQSDEDMEEIINDVMLKVWNRISSFDEKKGSFNSWITTIAHNAAVDKLKKRDKTIEYNDEILYQNDDDSELMQKVNDILAVVEGMNPKDQQLFYKRYSYQQSIEDIASEMNLTKRAVESSLYRIRNRIRERLGTRYGRL